MKKVLVTSKRKLQTLSIKDERKTFVSLYVGLQTREGDVEDLFKHEQYLYPLSLSEFRTTCELNQSYFLHCSEPLSHAKRRFPNVSVGTIDGATLVQILKPKKSKLVGHCCKEFYERMKILLKYSDVTRIDIAIGCYFNENSKQQTQQSRGTGINIYVQEITSI